MPRGGCRVRVVAPFSPHRRRTAAAMATLFVRSSNTSLRARPSPPSILHLVLFRHRQLANYPLLAGAQPLPGPSIAGKLLDRCLLLGGVARSFPVKMRAMPHVGRSISGMPEKTTNKQVEYDDHVWKEIRMQTNDLHALSEKSEAYSKVKKHVKMYNLLKHADSFDKIIDSDELFQTCCPLLGRSNLWQLLVFNRRVQMAFLCYIQLSVFREYLVKYCSHSEYEEQKIWLFKKMFPETMRCTLNMFSQEYYERCIRFRYKELPEWFKDELLREIVKKKEEVRSVYRKDIADNIMQEIEDDVIERMNGIIVTNGDPDVQFILA